ncbi:MAG: hypothetical protein HYX86_03355 [Chloroflexi bacterium]|nr:hypothetical protein [Chloroflexota bacterium]
MGALEILLLVVIIIFALVGAVRGYPKELGTTTGLLVALLVLSEWGEEIFTGLDSTIYSFLGLSFLASSYASLWQALSFLGLYVLMVFLAYHGETLAFRGTAPPGPLGMTLNIANGAVNGYLIAGSVWYYLYRFDYPLRIPGLFPPPLTDLTQSLLPLLPVTLLQPHLLLFIAFLLLMRIMR